MNENTHTLDDASDVLATAAALGMNVPAPEGTCAYELIVHYSTGSTTDLSIYHSFDDAYNAFSDWIVDGWEACFYQPWNRTVIQQNMPVEEYDREFAEWLTHQTAQDIISLWEDMNTRTAKFSVTPVLIRSCVNPRAGRTPSHE